MSRTVASSAWTAEDRALMLAWRQYAEGLCECGFPKFEAWHPDNDGAYHVEGDDEAMECHACTESARATEPEAKPVRYRRITYKGPVGEDLGPWPKRLKDIRASTTSAR